jgi:hypothetical protein
VKVNFPNLRENPCPIFKCQNFVFHMILVGHVALPGQRVRCPLSESGGLGPGGCPPCPRIRPRTATQSDLQPMKGILAGHFSPQFASGKILKCGERRNFGWGYIRKRQKQHS